MDETYLMWSNSTVDDSNQLEKIKLNHCAVWINVKELKREIHLILIELAGFKVN